MIKSRSFKKKLMRACTIVGALLFAGFLVVGLHWLYTATTADVAKHAVEDSGYSSVVLDSKSFSAFSGAKCEKISEPVVLVFDAVNTTTQAEAQVVVCASPDRIGRIYVK